MPSAAAPIRVMIVDDDAMVLTGLDRILSTPGDIEVVAAARSGEDAIEKAHKHFPDVVLMDLSMPGIGGVEAIRSLRNGLRPPTVVALTGFDTENSLLQSLEAGAVGFLLKDIGPEELIDTVRRAHLGQPVFSPQAVRRLMSMAVENPDRAAQKDAWEKMNTLTEKEREVALHLHAGLTNSEIAAAMYVGESTVKTHLNRVLLKLDCESRTSAAVLVERARHHR